VKSSEAPKWRAPADPSSWVAFGAVVLAIVLVAFARPPLNETFHEVKVGTDVYPLPSPEQTVVLSLGYRAAAADALYAHVLVSYGLHFQEKRRFEFVGNYLDTINALDPKFRAPYRFADTLLTLGPVKPRQRDYDKAREILERGMQEFPYDGELWNGAGQFMAYLAPAAFEDPEKKKEWKLAGARRLARACELIGSNENLPFHCVTAAGILSRAGEREATIQFLQRVIAVSDNEEIRQLALGYLGKVMGSVEKEEVEWRVNRFTHEWSRDMSFAKLETELIIGPPKDVAACAGGAKPRSTDCASSWTAWGERIERR
jgi:tetratricopeptide (TPR) repeat protein